MRPSAIRSIGLIIVACVMLGGCEQPAPSKPRLSAGDPVDVAVVTVIGAEYQAMLAQMDRVFPARVGNGEVNSFAWKGAEIDRPDGKPPLRLVIALAGEAGTTSGALAVLETATTWRPRVLVLAGIAGGLPPKVGRGDVVISRTVWGYEYGAIGTEFAPRRDWTFQSDPLLVRAASDYTGDWQREIKEPRPDGDGSPRQLVAVTASGNKVIETLDSAYVDRVLSHLPDTASVEMEAAGAFAAVELLAQRPNGPALLMLRGISDIPNPRAGTFGDKRDRERWKRYAADSVGAFTKAFLRDGLAVLDNASPTRQSDALIVTYSPAVCAALGTRLAGGPATLASTPHRISVASRTYSAALQTHTACLDDRSDRAALQRAIDAAAPVAVLLVDTALGVGAAKIGDIAVARLITPFDHGDDGPNIRNADGVRGARSLIAAGQSVAKAHASRHGEVRFGAIAAGEPSIESHDPKVIEGVLEANPRTIAIDRESAAVISALRGETAAHRAPLFLSIQGIDQVIGTADTDAAKAAASAATYLMALLEHAWPSPPLGH